MRILNLWPAMCRVCSRRHSDHCDFEKVCVFVGGATRSCALLRLITVPPLFPSLDSNVSFLWNLFWPVFYGSRVERVTAQTFRKSWSTFERPVEEEKKLKKKVFSILRSFICPSDGAALIYLGRLTNRPPLRRCHRRRQLLTMRLFVPHLWAAGLRGAGVGWPKRGWVPLSGWRKAINSISMGSLWK